ncbi:hypothetical protein CCP4SC76_7860002 [Gammaproteobacteria bacterium]
MNSNPAKPANASDEPDVSIDADFLNELNRALAEKEHVSLDLGSWDEKLPDRRSSEPLPDEPFPSFPDISLSSPDMDETFPSLSARKPLPWESSTALEPDDMAPMPPSHLAEQTTQPTRAARVADSYRTVREEPEADPEMNPPDAPAEAALSPDFQQFFARHSEQLRAQQAVTAPPVATVATAAIAEKSPAKPPEKAAEKATEKSVEKPVEKRVTEAKTTKPREEAFLADVVKPAPATAGVSSRMSLALSVAGVLAGAAGLWSSAGWQEAVSRLETRLERPPAVTVAPAPESVARWAGLEHQVNALTAELGALKSSLSSGEVASRDRAVLVNTDLEPLLARLHRLENTLTALEQKSAQEYKPPREAKPRRVANAPPKERHDEPASAAAPAATPTVTGDATPHKENETPVPVASPTASRVANGAWVVNILSVDSAADADREQRHLGSLGVETEVEKVNLKGKTWFRIRSTGFADANAARRYAAELRDKHGVKGPWVGRR